MFYNVLDVLIIHETHRLLKRHIWMFGDLGEIVGDTGERQSSICSRRDLFEKLLVVDCWWLPHQCHERDLVGIRKIRSW